MSTTTPLVYRRFGQVKMSYSRRAARNLFAGAHFAQ
jgi:hypothetical protein